MILISWNYGIIDSFLKDVDSLLPKAMPDAGQTLNALKPVSFRAVARTRPDDLYHR
jgi:hypothetical protein